MKNLLLLLISIIILFAVGLSIYINYQRNQTELRIINMVKDIGDLTISVNDFEIPYPLGYGIGSEYFSFPGRFVNADLKITDAEENQIIFEDIALSHDSLNTLLLSAGSSADIIYSQFTTPRVLSVDRTAIRYLRNPVFTNVANITITNDRMSHSFSDDVYNVDDYVILEDGVYRMSVIIDGEEKLFRLFLEQGEYYSITILERNDAYSPVVRIFVDNLPGDQYITPSVIN